MSSHHTHSSLIKDRSEQAQSDWLECVSIRPSTEVETIALSRLLQCRNVYGLAWLLLKHEDGVAVVWRSLLGEGWKP